MWLPSLWIWHHAIQKLSHSIFALGRNETCHLVCDADNADEESDGQDINDTAHISYPNAILPLLDSQRSVGVLQDLVGKRALVDRAVESGDGKIDGML